MKLQTQRQEVERIGVEGEQAFQIKTTAQAFDILSSGIYSDPIMAVIRELSCNAYDSHVEAGKGDTPFEVHLPSKLEPWFAVIDHGVGLSDEQARGLFTTYFDSTKTLTNDQIGAFGLGSKSPFSYSKAFEVIARYDGEKRSYSIFLDEHGVPTIATLSKITTDECNGVEVRLAVRSEDFYSFKDKTAEILRYFPVKPTVKGSAGFEFQDRPKEAIEGDGYYVYPSQRYYNRTIIAVQGNVPYKVEYDHLRDDISPSLSSFLEKFSFVGYFEIGELDVAASREEVRYEKNTKANLINKLERAREDFLKRLDTEVDDLAKSGKAWDVYAKLFERFRYTDRVKNIAGDYKFKNAMFNKWIEDNNRLIVDAGMYHTIKTYQYGSTRATPHKMPTVIIESKDVGDPARYAPYVTPKETTAVMLNDVTKRSAIRINHFIRDHSTMTNVIAIAPISDRILQNAGKAVPTEKARKAELERILKEMGNPTIKTLSVETNDVTVQGKARTGGNTFKKFNSDKYIRNDRMKPIFNEVEEPTTGENIYIEITQLRDTVLNGKNRNWNHREFDKLMGHMLQVINMVNKTTYVTSDIFGLTKKVCKVVAGKKGWNNIEELYKKAVPGIKDLLETYSRVNATSDNYGVSAAIKRPSFARLVNKLDTSSHFRTTVEPALSASKKVTDAHNKGFTEYTANYISNMNRRLDIDLKLNEKPFFKNSDFVNYPMLKLTGVDASTPEGTQTIADYIALIES